MNRLQASQHDAMRDDDESSNKKKMVALWRWKTTTRRRRCLKLRKENKELRKENKELREGFLTEKKKKQEIKKLLIELLDRPRSWKVPTEDKDILLAALTNRDVTKFNFGHPSVLHSLWDNDPVVANALFSRAFNGWRTWNDLSAVCKADPTVILTAFHMGKIKLFETDPGDVPLAPPGWKRNWEFLKSVHNSRGLPWNVERLRKLATANPQLALDLFRSNHIYAEWENLRPPQWENIRIEDLPCLTRTFLKKAFEDGKIFFYQLPQEIQEDADFFLSCDRFAYGDEALELFEDVIAEHPALCLDVAFLHKHLDLGVELVDRDWHEILEQISQSVEGARVCSDHALMLKFCQLNLMCFSFVAAALKIDRSFVAALLKTKPSFLYYTSNTHRDIQSQFPDLIISSLADFAMEEGTYLGQGDFDPELFESRAFVLKWFEAGFYFCPQVHTQDWANSEEAFLLIAAAHRQGDLDLESLRCASLELRKSKEFMLKLVETDPRSFVIASVDLQQDYDLACLAFSGSSAFAHEYFGETKYADKADFVDKLLETMHENLAVRDIFPVVWPNVSSRLRLAQGDATELSLRERYIRGVCRSADRKGSPPPP